MEQDKKEDSVAETLVEQLEASRKEINAIDQELVQLIKERLRIAEEIGRIKQQMGKPIKDVKRGQEVIASCTKQAESLGIPFAAEIIPPIWEKLMEAAVKVEEENKP